MIGSIAALVLGATCLGMPNQSHSQQAGLSLVVSTADTGAGDSNRKRLYDKGISYEEFLAGVEIRKERWHRNTRSATIGDRLLNRASAIKGHWRLLVVAVDGCSDAVSTIPYLARLAADFDNIDLRIVDATVGREVMLAHKTPDGRAATPTVVVLNDEFEEVGCFVERPAMLQVWATQNRDVLDEDEYLKQKFDWYDKEGGQQTLEAIIQLLEAADEGSAGCD